MKAARRQRSDRRDAIAPPVPAAPPVAPTMLTIASYVLAAVALLTVLLARLLPALLAGLLVYSLINALAPSLQRHLPGSRAHWFVVAVIAVIVVGSLTLAIVAIIGLLGSEDGNPIKVLNRAMPLIERIRAQVPAVIVSYLPENGEQIRVAVVNWLREHAMQLRLVGTQAGRVVVQLLIGIVLGAMLALYKTRVPAVTGPLPAALAQRCTTLLIAFHNIVFAQAKISAVNTLLTGIFLLVVLPLFGVSMPLAKTLVIITFIVGLLPVVGNLISNTLIFCVGLAVSVWVAVASLAYLIIIHKLEYFLNAGIVGTQIRARAWELLIAMLVMEAIFGVGGLIAAPIYYAYVKRELEAARLI